MIGFLSPEGEFIECSTWEHISKAQEIALDRYGVDIYSGIDAEDYLLSLGYLVLRSRDAYMSYWNDNQWIVLTDPQLSWLNDNIEALTAGQREDINEILSDQEDIRKRVSKEG